MHNKFIICYDLTDDESNEICMCSRGEVLTGSYNYTENSKNSLENIICIKDKKIVNAYQKQFGEIAVMSVQLDWSGDWDSSDSDLRYGT